MKKLLFVILITITIGCARKEFTPIERYVGFNYVIAEIEDTYALNYNLRLKNKDTIFYISVLNIDGKKLKVGDTLK